MPRRYMCAAEANVAPFVERMQAAGMPDAAIAAFRYYYEQLAAGATGYLPEADLEPVPDLPDAEDFPEDLARVGQEAVRQTVLLKLNGGLGTTMGLERAKSL